MGYYTRYNLLETTPEISTVPGLPEAIEVLDGGGLIDRDGSCLDEWSWYEHEEEMGALSEQFPDVTFVLHGEGEEQGDVWDKYFKYGKLQATARPEVVWPDVDTSKFKSGV